MGAVALAKFQLDAELGEADIHSVAKRLQKKVDAGHRVNLQTYEETGNREPFQTWWLKIEKDGQFVNLGRATEVSITLK